MRRRELLALGGGLAAAGALSSCGKPLTEQDFGPRAAAPEHRAVTGLGDPAIAGTEDGTIPPSYLAYPEDPVRTVSGVPGDGRPVTMLTQTFSPIPPAVDNNPFWSALNEKLGSALQIQIVSQSDYSVKFATTVAGGALPDLFFLDPDFPRTPQLMAARAADLTDHLAGDAILQYPNLANLPTDCWEAGRFNGRLYGLPSPRGAFSSGVLLRRDDLLAKQGIRGEFGSFADFLGVCRQVTDPRAGVWANTDVPMQYLRNMLSIPNFWSYDGTRMQSWWTAPGQEQALAAGRQLVSEGLINPDAFSAPQKKTWFGTGKAYFTTDAFSGWGSYYGSHTRGDGFRIGGATIPAFDGNGSGRMWLSFPSYGTSGISVDARTRIPTLLRIADYLAAPFGSTEYLQAHYGTAGTDYTMKNRNPVATSSGSAGSQLGTDYIVDAPEVNYIPGQPEAVRDVDTLLRTLVPQALTNDAVYLFSPTAAERFPRSQTMFSGLENDILQGRRPVSDWGPEASAWWQRYGLRMSDELTAAYHEAGRG